MKGCGGCHKIGLKTAGRDQGAGADRAAASASPRATPATPATRSRVIEARQPQACQTCHMGFDHPQWEMYSALQARRARAAEADTASCRTTAAAPTCQTCHMQEGNHEVRTAWGFLAVRLPLPDDKQWAADQVDDPAGARRARPGRASRPARLDVVKAADVARLDAGGVGSASATRCSPICSQCHSANFAKGELQKGDDMIRDADHLMAEAIRDDRRALQGRRPDASRPSYAAAFPDLLTFHDAPTADRAEALRHAPRAPHARLPGHVPRQSRLRPVVRLERDEAGSAGDQGACDADARRARGRFQGRRLSAGGPVHLLLPCNDARPPGRASLHVRV